MKQTNQFTAKKAPKITFFTWLQAKFGKEQTVVMKWPAKLTCYSLTCSFATGNKEELEQHEQEHEKN